MTTSFNAGNPGAPSNPATTPAPVAPGAASPEPNAGDNAVVFEHGGRKFTAADLVKKISHADTFIDDLKNQVKERDELLTKANQALEKQVGALELLQRVTNPAAPAAAEPAVQAPAASPVAPVIDPDAIANQVMTSIEQAQIKKLQDQNFQKVSVALTQAFGDKVDEAVRNTCTELGLSYDDGVALARRSPDAFLRMFPAVSAPANPGVGHGKGFNSQAFKNAGTKTPSGYVGARTAKDRTAAYLKLLNAN